MFCFSMFFLSTSFFFFGKIQVKRESRGWVECYWVGIPKWGGYPTTRTCFFQDNHKRKHWWFRKRKPFTIDRPTWNMPENWNEMPQPTANDCSLSIFIFIKVTFVCLACFILVFSGFLILSFIGMCWLFYSLLLLLLCSLCSNHLHQINAVSR